MKSFIAHNSFTCFIFFAFFILKASASHIFIKTFVTFNYFGHYVFSFMLLIFLTTIVGFGTFFLLRIIVILRCSIIVSLMFMYIIFAMNGMNKINNSPPSISDFRSFTAPNRAITNNGTVINIDIALIQNRILCSSAFNFFIKLFPFFYLDGLSSF